MKKNSVFIIVLSLLLACAFTLTACQKDNNAQCTITFDSQGGTSISQVKVNEGGSISAPEAPSKEGYDFLGWFYDAAATDAVNFNTFKAIKSMTLYAGWIDCNINPHAIKIAITGEGSGTSEKATAVFGETIKIAAYGSYGYKLGSAALNGTATPLINDESSEDVYLFTMPATVAEITLNFVLDEYPITIASSANGRVICDKETAKMGDELHFTAMPNAGYYLQNLQALTTSMNANNLTMEMAGQELYVVAYFATIDYFTTRNISVNLPQGVGGEIKVDKTSAATGEYVRVEVIPPQNYALASLTMNGSAISSSFVMPSEAVVLEATFEPIAEEVFHSLTVTPSDHGSVSASCDIATPGTLIELDITADNNYSLDAVWVNGKSIGDSSFVMPNDDVTITAAFSRNPYEIITESYAYATLTASKSLAYKGDIVTYTVTVTDENYYFVEGSVKINGITADTSEYFTMPDDNAQVSATFMHRPTGSGSDGNITIPKLSNGKIEVSSTTAKAGAQILVDIIPDDGYTLKAGTLAYNGIAFEGDMFIMPAGNVILSAEFEKLYTIQEYISDDGFLVPNKYKAVAGEVITLQAQVFSGCTLKGSVYYATQSGNATPVNITNMTFKMPQSDVVLSANFRKQQSEVHNISIDTTIEGGTVIVGKAQAKGGEKISVCAIPDSGKNYAKIWLTGDESELTENIADYFTMPEQAITIHCSFVDSQEENPSAKRTLKELFEANKVSYAKLSSSIYFSERASDIKSILTSNNAERAAEYINAMLVFDGGLRFFAFECNNASNASYVSSALYEGFRAYMNSDVEVAIFNNTICVVSLSASAADDYNILETGLIYTNDYIFAERADGSYSSVKYIGEPCTVLSVPTKYNGRAVTKICSYAFENIKDTLEVLHLGYVDVLAPFALSDLSALESIDIGTIRTIGIGAFKGATALTEYKVSADNTNFTVKNDVLYTAGSSAGTTSLVAYPLGKKATEYTIEKGCIAIMPYAFYNMKGLRTVDTALVTLKTIGKYAFYGCSDLNTIALDRVADIGDYAFYGADSIASVNLTSLKRIGKDVFSITANGSLNINLGSNVIKSTANNANWLSIEEEASAKNLKIYAKYLNFDNLRSSAIFRIYSEFMNISGEDLIGSQVAVIYEVPINATYVPTERLTDNRSTAQEPEAPTMEGYEFAGWYTDKALTEEFSGFDTIITSTMRLYAKFTKK